MTLKLQIEGTRMMNQLKLTVLVSSTLFLVACGGSDGDSSFISDDGIPKNNIAAPVVKLRSILMLMPMLMPFWIR